MNQKRPIPKGLPPDLLAYQAFKGNRLFLPSAGIIVTGEPTSIITILGPCVSICLFDANRRIGGMNHYLLPNAPAGSRTSVKYGDAAYQTLYTEMLRAGANRQSMVASVFGGARILPTLRDVKDSIGQKNWELAIELLEADRIPIVNRDVGGTRPRKVIFQTDNGATSVTRSGEADNG